MITPLSLYEISSELVGSRCYAKYTGYRDEPNGGVWFGAVITAQTQDGYDLQYDDGDVTGAANPHGS